MHRFCCAALLTIGVICLTCTEVVSQRVKQPREVVEAYRVCAEFQRLLADDLDFDRAFQATFTKDAKRLRAIAIAESELGDVNFTQVDYATLLSLYKDQHQLFFLMLPLIEAKDELDRSILFPPPIEGIFDRLKLKPKDDEELRSYAAQLKRDVADFRAHLHQLSTNYPLVAEAIRKYKEGLSRKLEPPRDHVVKPLTAYSKGRVLGLKQEYYQIDSFAVIREGGPMKIIGIRFFTSLF